MDSRATWFFDSIELHHWPMPGQSRLPVDTPFHVGRVGQQVRRRNMPVCERTKEYVYVANSTLYGIETSFPAGQRKMKGRTTMSNNHRKKGRKITVFSLRVSRLDFRCSIKAYSTCLFLSAQQKHRDLDLGRIRSSRVPIFTADRIRGSWGTKNTHPIWRVHVVHQVQTRLETWNCARGVIDRKCKLYNFSIHSLSQSPTACSHVCWCDGGGLSVIVRYEYDRQAKKEMMIKPIRLRIGAIGWVKKVPPGRLTVF